MRKVSEKSMLTALVNYKCVGKLGMKGLSIKERGLCIDGMIEKGWLKKDMSITDSGNEIVKKNLHLLQY